MKKLKGFTLPELMVTVAIIAILASISVPFYKKHVARSKAKQGYTILIEVKAKQEQYRARFLSYADDLSKLPGFDTASTGSQEVGDFFEVKITAATNSTFTAQATDTKKATGWGGSGAVVWQITQNDDIPVAVKNPYD